MGILDDDEDDSDDYCTLCKGTGIGQHGDPNTSRCRVCHGTGISSSRRQEQRERDAEIRRDMAIDREMLEKGETG